jgi:hypothetical protein
MKPTSTSSRKLILALQYRLATLCLMERRLAKREAALRKAYRAQNLLRIACRDLEAYDAPTTIAPLLTAVTTMAAAKETAVNRPHA